MPRVIVVADNNVGLVPEALMDEEVRSDHLDTHSATQLVERVGWAIRDAEEGAGEQAA